MNTHNFTLVNLDTDSITICKPDHSPVSPEDQKALLAELNSLYPELIHWEDDGCYPCVLVVKAKNYVLYDGHSIKIKGSGLKGSTKSPALKEYTKKLIETLVFTPDTKEAHTKLVDLYNQYMVEICSIKTAEDMKRWAVRKTYSAKIDESERTTEAKILAALQGSDYREGDRFYTFFKSDDSQCLVERFDGDYNKKRLLKNLYDTTMIFDTVLPAELFKNYSLVKNACLLPGYVAPPPKVKAVRKPKKKGDTMTVAGTTYVLTANEKPN